MMNRKPTFHLPCKDENQMSENEKKEKEQELERVMMQLQEKEEEWKKEEFIRIEMERDCGMMERKKWFKG